MEAVIQHFNRDKLLNIASSLRPVWEKCHFVQQQRGPVSSKDLPLNFITDNGILMLLAFANNPFRRAVRLPLSYGEDVGHWGVSLVHTLQFIAEALPNIPAPRIHSYSLIYDSLVGVPYILLDWIEGSQLPVFTDTWFSPSQRFKILDQLNDILVEFVVLLTGLQEFGIMVISTLLSAKK